MDILSKLKSEVGKLADDYRQRPSKQLIEAFRDKKVELDLAVSNLGQAAYDAKIGEFKAAVKRLPEIEKRRLAIAKELEVVNAEFIEALAKVEAIKAQARGLEGESWGLWHEGEQLRMRAQQGGASLEDEASWRPIAEQARRDAIGGSGVELKIENGI